MRFIDSNVFVYHLAGDPRYGDRASEILERVERGERAATSTLVAIQVCSYLRWKGKAGAIQTFPTLLRSLPALTKTETTFEDLIHAAETCGKIGWKRWDDAVIAAQIGGSASAKSTPTTPTSTTSPT